MATVSTFNVALAASVARFIAPVRNAERTWASLARTVQRGARTMEESQRRTTLASIALARSMTRLAAVIGTTGAGFAAWGVRLAAQFEQSQIAFETLLGSADEAREFLSTLERFARRTPFGFAQLQEMARGMLAWGFAREQVEQMLPAIGDFAAAMGGGQETMDRVIRALGQIRTRGRLASQEMLQLTEAGIPAWQILAERIGVSTKQLQDMASKGAVPAQLAIAELVRGLEERFAGAMARQAQTMLGRWERIKDSVATILRGLGEEIIRVTRLAQGLERLADALERFADAVSEKGFTGALREAFPPWVEPLVIGLAGAIGGALVPAVIALAKAMLALAVANGLAALSLGSWALVGAAVAVVIYGLIRIVQTWNGATEAANQTAQEAAETQRVLTQAITELTDAAADNIQAFDEIHELQQDMDVGTLPPITPPAPPGAPPGTGEGLSSLADAIGNAAGAASDSIVQMARALDEARWASDLARLSWADASMRLQTLRLDAEGAARPLAEDLRDALADMPTTTGEATSAWERLRDAVATGWDTAVSTVQTAWGDLRTAVEDAVEAISARPIEAPVLMGDWDAAARTWQSIQEAFSPISVPAIQAPGLAGNWSAAISVRDYLARRLSESVQVAPIPAPILAGDWGEPVARWSSIREALGQPIAVASIPAPTLEGDWTLAERLYEEARQVLGQPIAVSPIEAPALSGNWTAAVDTRDYLARRLAEAVQVAPIAAPALTGDWSLPANQWAAIGYALSQPVVPAPIEAPRLVGDWSLPASELAGIREVLGRPIEPAPIQAPALAGDWAAPAATWSSIREALGLPIILSPIQAPVLEGDWQALPRAWGEIHQALVPISPPVVPAPELTGDWTLPAARWADIRDVLTQPIEPPAIQAPALAGPWDRALRVWDDVRLSAESMAPAVASSVEIMADAAEEHVARFSGAADQAVDALGRWQLAIGQTGEAWEAFLDQLRSTTAGTEQASTQVSNATYRLATSTEVSAAMVRAALSGAAAGVQQSASAIDLSLAQASQHGRANLGELAQRGAQWLQQLSAQGQAYTLAMVTGILAAFATLYQQAVGQSWIPDLVNRSLELFGQLRDGAVQAIDQMKTRIGILLTDAVNEWLHGTTTFEQAATRAFAAIGEAAKQSLAEQISQAAAKGLSMLGQWVLQMLPKVAEAIAAFISQAYWTLVAFYAWSGPLAPVLAGGTIAAAFAGAVALARQAADLIGLAEGGIVTGPMVAMLGEGRRREAVIPLERDNVIAESVGDAVYEAMVTALRGMAAAGTPQAGGQPAEIVLRIDSTEFARVALPALEREAERRGMRLLMRPAGAM